MTIALYPRTGWDEQRRPLDDEAADAERRARYWEWSNAGGFEDGRSDLIRDLGDGRSWKVLSDRIAADYEAFHMQHSIGYNWDHYSGMGTIASLRDARNVPSVTILVVGTTVVHARRRENAPLGVEDFVLLEELAREQGWTVLEQDRL